jgi:hypothetical protein
MGVNWDCCNINKKCYMYYFETILTKIWYKYYTMWVYSNISDRITCFHNFVINSSIIIFSQNSTLRLTANIYLIINGIFFVPSYILVIFIMESEKKKRPPYYSLEIPGDENYKIVIQEKLQIVKNYLTRTLRKSIWNSYISSFFWNFLRINHQIITFIQ